MELESLSLHLPAYLTVESKNALKEALKTFPNISYDKFYTDYLKDQKVIFQGDGLTGLTFVNLSTQAFKTNGRGIILSNTCDMYQENERYFTSYMIYAPIVSLEAYSQALIHQGISTEKVKGHVEAIKSQSITQILYLPARNGIIDESIVFFDQVQSIETENYSIEHLDQNRIFTLSDFGHYLFLFKLSFHFTRFQDKVERRSVV